MDKTIILWDVSTGQSLRKYRGHLGTVNCVKFNEDSSVAISGSVDTSVRCWDCRSKKPEAFQIMQEAKDSVSSVQVTDHEILTGSLDGQIRRYDIRNGQLIADEMARKSFLVFTEFSFVCSVGSKKLIYLFTRTYNFGLVYP